MKLILKIFKYLALALVVVLVVLVILSLLIQGRITAIFTSEVNKLTETGVYVDDLGFSLIRGFPRATVEFKSLRLEAPRSEDPWIDSLLEKNYILEAASAYASFNVKDIIRKEYTIERITLKNSSLNIFKDEHGEVLKNILKEEYRSDSARISFDLQDIRIENTNIKYFSSPNHFLVDCRIDNARGSLSHKEDITSIGIKTGFDLKGISSKDKLIISSVEKGSVDGELVITSDSLCFNKILLVANNQELNLDGCLLRKDRKLGMSVSTYNTELAEFLSFIQMNKQTTQKIGFKILEAEFGLDLDNPAESFNAGISSLSAVYAGSEYHGSVSLVNLNNPYIDARLHSKVDLVALSAELQGEEIESLQGSIYLNAMFSGRTGNLRNIGRDKILNLERRVNLHLSDVKLKVKSYEHPVENISGNIMIADNAWGDELSFSVAEQNLVMNCMISNPEGLLNLNREIIDIKAGIWADRLNKDLFLTWANKRQTTKDERKHSSVPVLKRVTASLNINCDSLIVDNFKASQFDGIINYRPGLLNISSFNLLALEGTLSGNAALIEDSGGTLLARGWFDIGTVDIHKAFNAFNNFKQDKLLADNIKGNISGSVSISTKLDSTFRLLSPSLSVTGNYSISNGALIDFEPAKKLSRFIEVAELENIRFNELHNDLVIADKRVLIPSMEINSSAFNISLSGEQSFSGDYEYHLSILLSEILSSKARNSGSYISEFGRVEDDGLGRTTLFLKLEKGDEGTRVSYDVKKLSEEIKESLKEEKQSLKAILNEEYGWYKADSILRSPETGTRKFRITWEEADSVKTLVPEETQVRKGILKRLFKPDTTNKKF